jgi:hypothetical protein
MLRKDQTNPKSRTDKRRKESMANSIPISFSFFLVITQPNNSCTMSSTSLPLFTCIPASTPPPSPSPLAVSAPENMPVCPLSPQLAQHTEPLLILEDVNDTAMSIIKYLSITNPKPNEEAPVGFIPNNRDGRHFYPI